MHSFSASYESGFGMITSQWENIDGRLTWRIRIPENNRGIIQVPTCGMGTRVMLNAVAADVIHEEGGFSLIGEYGTGEYLVEI